MIKDVNLRHMTSNYCMICLAGELVVLPVVLVVLIVSGVQHVNRVTFCTSSFSYRCIKRKREREGERMRGREKRETEEEEKETDRKNRVAFAEGFFSSLQDHLGIKMLGTN